MNKNTFEYFYDYLESVGYRFQSMSDHEIDTEGLVAFEKMLSKFIKTKRMTPGEFKYLFDRTHPLGKLSKYNKHAGLHKKHGDMLECPAKYIAEHHVDWTLPRDRDFVTLLEDELDCRIPNRYGKLPIKFDSDLFE